MGSFLHLTFRLSTNESPTLASVKQLFRIQESEELDQPGDHSCPACLVARAKPGSIVAVEVFVEEDVVAPVGVSLELLRAAIDGSPASLPRACRRSLP